MKTKQQIQEREKCLLNNNNPSYYNLGYYEALQWVLQEEISAKE